MYFTEAEAEAKKGEQVCVRDDSFSRDGIAKGTMGRVRKAQLLGKTGAGPGQVMNPMKEIWVVDVKFDVRRGQPKTLPIGKEEYERSLEEIEKR